MLYAREISIFLERKIESIDFREALIDSPRSRAIVEVIWSLMSLPLNSLDISLAHWLKKIYFTLYGSSVPKFMMKWQEERGIQQAMPFQDENWSTDVVPDIVAREAKMRPKPTTQQMQKSFDGQRLDKLDTKLKIILPVD